jgi:hypothetical protein
MVAPASLRQKGSRLGLTLLSLVALGGCKQGDPEKCTQAQTVVRTSLDAEDFGAARQWREYAHKQCEDKSALPALDQSIVDREAQVAARKAAAAKLEQDTKALAKLFFEFVAQHRAAPQAASQAPVCDQAPAGAPPDSKERLCTATRQAGSRPFEVRYWDAEPTAFRFSTTLDGELDCRALNGTVSKQWDVAAVGGKTAKRTRCDLGGALQGLTAVLTAAGRAPIHVVSPSYVARDPGWRVILEGP